MDRETGVIIPSSPTISSLSSSDLDTESTSSFFPDRSTTLGILMGVSFPDAPARASRRTPLREHPNGAAARKHREAAGRRSSSRGGKGRRKRWWMLCREEDMARRTSLGEFLQVERRLGCSAAMDQAGAACGGGPTTGREIGGAGPLFEDGRVLPPQRRDQQREGALMRIPVLLTGICSGGEW